MRAAEVARALRREAGSGRGEVDLKALAHRLGLVLFLGPFYSLVEEVKVGPYSGVAVHLSREERRWAVAHAIGHHRLHPGNLLMLRRHTHLTEKIEREAEEFAWHLLVDEEEARRLDLPEPWQIAEYFRAPQVVVRRRACSGPLVLW